MGGVPLQQEWFDWCPDSSTIVAVVVAAAVAAAIVAAAVAAAAAVVVAAAAVAVVVAFVAAVDGWAVHWWSNSKTPQCWTLPTVQDS